MKYTVTCILYICLCFSIGRVQYVCQKMAHRVKPGKAKRLGFMKTQQTRREYYYSKRHDKIAADHPYIISFLW